MKAGSLLTICFFNFNEFMIEDTRLSKTLYEKKNEIIK